MWPGSAFNTLRLLVLLVITYHRQIDEDHGVEVQRLNGNPNKLQWAVHAVSQPLRRSTRQCASQTLKGLLIFETPGN